MVRRVSRRGALAMGACACLPVTLCAASVITLDWPDLLPKGETYLPPLLQGLIDHTGPDMSFRQPPSSGVRTEWNGQTVRMRGFVVPLEMDGFAVRTFLLVPFVGACIHVPPPPANQLVFVTTETPYESDGLYAPVHVTGLFGVTSVSTELAQVGYAMTAETIEPFEF